MVFESKIGFEIFKNTIPVRANTKPDNESNNATNDCSAERNCSNFFWKIYSLFNCITFDVNGAKNE